MGYTIEKMIDMQEQLKNTAVWNGRDGIHKKFIEETIELTSAWRKGDLADIIEEIADVENIIQQMKYFHGIKDEEVLVKRAEKSKRTVKRYSIGTTYEK